MTQLQLPAHLQGRQSTGMAARASEGMGSSLPPHISIQGNKFTFVDASGNEMQPMLTFDGYIIDISDHMNKRYYDKPFEQNAATYEPPVCWSANGIAPSREATKPQAATCESCPMNVRGSAISKMSGAAIKACRDEKWLAVVCPMIGTMVFQLVVTPGSFKNWKAFTAGLENYKVDPHWVLTRFGFEDKTNGVLNWAIAGWTSPEHLQVIDTMMAEKKTDLIVGRLDQPRTAALPAPSQPNTAAQLPPNNFAPPQGQQQVPFGAQQAASQPMQQTTPMQPMNAAPAAANDNAVGFPSSARQQEIIPPGAQPQVPFGQPAPSAAGFGQPNTPPAGSFAPNAAPMMQQPTGAPSAGPAPAGNAPVQQPQQPTTRRRRNTAANAAPAQAPAQAAPAAPQQGFQPGPAPQAPFAAPAGQPGFQSPANQAPAGAAFPTATAPQQGNNFGMGGGAPVDPAMSQMLGQLFQPQG